MTDKTIKEYRDQYKKLVKAQYSAIKKVYCPCLKEYIFFNSQGLHHLLYDVTGRERRLQEQVYRLKLFPLVIPVIKKANKVYLHQCRKNITIAVKRGKKQKKNVDYWALMEIVGSKNDAKIKVILRKVGDGHVIFWSVMKMKTKTFP